MPVPGVVSRRSLAGPAIVAFVAICLGLAAPTAALADDAQIKLALLPIGQAGSFYDLTMKAGQSQTFSVEIANDGQAAIAARTYAADVYTIIDGGFGARLHDQPETGATRWLTYAPAVLQLAKGEGTRRSFTVAVPAGAGPGEYISSLVLENAQPIDNGDTVGLSQVVRQAVAVVVTVPGLRSPGLAIGGATDKVVGGTSTVQVAVQNTGNVRLKPIVGFTLTSPTGVEMTHATMRMDTFYSRTASSVEFPLGMLLAPGRYSVAVTLDDPDQGAQVEAAAIPLVVGAPSGPPAGSPAEGPLSVDTSWAGGSLPIAPLVVGAGLLVAFGLASIAYLNLRRRRVA